MGGWKLGVDIDFFGGGVVRSAAPGLKSRGLMGCKIVDCGALGDGARRRGRRPFATSGRQFNGESPVATGPRPRGTLGICTPLLGGVAWRAVGDRLVNSAEG